jgi:hypothetical protein
MNEDVRTRLAIANQTRATIYAAIVNLHGVVVAANAVVGSSLIVAYISMGGAYPLLVIVGSAISSIIVGLWRLYVQYLDNQIASLYPEIVLYEAMLPVITPRLTGIRHHLVNNCKSLEGIFTASLKPEQQAEVVARLVRERHIGSRGHRLFNLGAAFFIAVLFAISIVSVKHSDALWTWYYCLCVAGTAVGFALVGYAYWTGQKDPKECEVSGQIFRITQQ